MKNLYQLVLSLGLLVFSQLSLGASGGGNTAEGTQYVPIAPPFVVNITDGNKLRFMQVTAQFKVTNAEAAATIQAHISAVRHAMLMLLAEQKIHDMYTTRGKEKLRKKCLKEVKTVLSDYTDTKSIENIYFTGFIVQ